MDWIDEEMARRNRGQIRPLDQSQHRAINAHYWPGTREICAECGEPTGSGGGDESRYNEDGEPVCGDCDVSEGGS